MVLCLFLLAGFISIFFGVPGTFVIFFSTVLYGIFTGFERISGGMLLGLGLLTLCGEGLEYTLGLLGAKRFGSSNRGVIFSVIGGLIGAIVGAPFLFGIGAVLGALFGAFAGAVLIEILTQGLAEWRKAIRSGLGNFLGRLAGMITKIGIAIGMIVWILVSVL